jgi:diguanylate cyclase (GGDEF)-like protein
MTRTAKDLYQRILNRYDRKTRAIFDALVIFVLAIPAFAILLDIDGFELLYRWSRRHETWQLDEFFVLVLCVGAAAVVFSIRRVVDLGYEMEERKQAEEEAHQLARHDVLTGLPNRRRFLELFQKIVQDPGKDEVYALFLCDLDHFKPVNDLYGHRLGDEVLRVVAARLTELVDGQGTVARLGGDEFGILLHCPRESDMPMRLAGRAVHEIAAPIPLAALSLEVGISVGIAVYDPKPNVKTELSLRDGSVVETVLRQADMAMYRAKSEGRGVYRFFDPVMDEMLQERVQLEREIKGAIAKGQIVPYYQPLVDLTSHKILGYEILARWNHPERAVILPDVFIPIAEDTNTIGDLTYSVLAQAVRDAKAWPSDVFLSLNLSPRQFADPWLAQRILAILTEAGFPPQRLEIEITETAVVQRLDEAKLTLESLRNLGVSVALDDFGTGYSGLHHLRELTLDTLKIDRSFVMHMLTNPEEARIVEAILSLGKALGLQVTAEGIETKEVLDRLTELGCGTGQGFLFGKPAPAAALAPAKGEAAGTGSKVA